MARTLCDASAPTRRPSPDRWSANEYAAHVRDVLLTIRDRLVIGLVEDNPRFKPVYRDEGRQAVHETEHHLRDIIANPNLAAG